MLPTPEDILTRFSCNTCGAKPEINDEGLVKNFEYKRPGKCKPCSYKVKNEARNKKRNLVSYESSISALPPSTIDTNPINERKIIDCIRNFVENDSYSSCGHTLKELSLNYVKLTETEYQRYKLYGDLKSDYEDMVIKHNSLCDKYTEAIHQNNINSLKIDKLENTVKELKDLLFKFIK